MNTEPYKGRWCPYKTAKFCQEGYCQDCQIYYDRHPDKQLADLKSMKEVKY